jgi:hypothetical protein
MALDLGELHIRYKADKAGLRSELGESEREAERSGNRMASSFAAAAVKMARTIGSGFGKVAAEGAAAGMGFLSKQLGNLSTGVTNLATDWKNWVPLIATATVALYASVPAAQLLGGALGALPALATGGLAAAATLAIGFQGVSEAFKKAGSSGGSFVDRARQLVLAERRLTDANREALAAQVGLNRARAQAADRIRDLTINLASAQEDQADAADAVREAREELDAANASGNPDRIEDAERAYRRAMLAVQDVTNRVTDLDEEQAEAARTGVEGSDEVQGALERQRQAVEAVSDAHYELKRAQAPTGGGAADEAIKLASSAMSAIRTLRKLKDDWDLIRISVQERLFSGADKEIQALWDTWEPTLESKLGSMATMFNGLFKVWSETSRKPEFVKNIATGWASVEKMIDRVGKAILGPGLEAFGRLSAAAGPVLDAIGDGIGGIVEDFALWIKESEESGALKEFFTDTADFFGQVISVGGSVASIIGSILDIIRQSNGDSTDFANKNFAKGMEELAAWFDNPENQAKMVEVFGKVEEFVKWVKNDAIPAIIEWGKKFKEWSDKLQGWGDKASEFKTKVTGAFDAVTSAVTGMPDKIANAARGMWDGLKNSFRTALAAIITAWNAFELRMPETTFLGQKIGGFALSTPNIDVPMLADGGLVKPTPGGRLVGVAEAGQAEIVSPVPQMRQVFAEELARMAASQSTIVIEIPIDLGDDVTRKMRYELSLHDRKVRRLVDAGAGSY